MKDGTLIVIRRYLDTDETTSQCEYLENLNLGKSSAFDHDTSISYNSDNDGTSNNTYKVPLKDYPNYESFCYHTKDCYQTRSSANKEKYAEAFASTVYY